MNGLFNQKKTKSTTRSESRLIPKQCDYCDKAAAHIIVVGSLTGRTTIKCMCQGCMMRWDADKKEL